MRWGSERANLLQRSTSLGSISLLVLAAALLGPGCAGLNRVLGHQEQAERRRALGRISGNVDVAGGASGKLVVVLGVPSPEPDAPSIPLDTFVRLKPGPFVFMVEAGHYQLGAFEDRNDNGRLDADEPGLRVSSRPVFELAAGGTATRNLILDPHATFPELEGSNGFDVFEKIRSQSEQRRFTLWSCSVQGDVVEDLNDPSFGPEEGTRGLWQTMDFLVEGKAGIYFLEPYDPHRIPVLFVHGIAGNPQMLAPLMSGIDRERFQPWFYFYPSGFGLEGLAEHLATLIERLVAEHRFERMALVAYSMGGLVARGAIQRYAESTGRNTVRFLASISTPWGGEPSASNAKDAPFELPESLYDMSPESDYLRELFYRADGTAHPLPDGVRFHLLYGYHMEEAFLDLNAEANDGKVTLASMLRSEAQECANSERAYDQDHLGMLEDPAVIKHVNALLKADFRR